MIENVDVLEILINPHLAVEMRGNAKTPPEYVVLDIKPMTGKIRFRIGGTVLDADLARIREVMEGAPFG